MDVEIDPPDEWKAVGAEVLKAAIVKCVPGLAVPLEAYEALERRRKEKALEMFQAEVAARLERIEALSRLEWLETEDGKCFAGKVLAAALDAQMADKRQLFANALVNGACSSDLTFLEKAKFIDLLRSLSRIALDALAELHQIYGPAFRTPSHQRTQDTSIDRGRAAGMIAGKLNLDPYLIYAAIAELESAGLFSSATSWRKEASGHLAPGGGWLGHGVGYTEFTERFVQFIKDPS